MHESFPSWTTMLSVDFLLIALAIAGTGIVATRWRALRRAHAALSVVLMLFGYWLAAGIYVADAVIMLALPAAIGMPRAMALMHDLHLGFAWYVNVAAGLFLLLGMTLTIHRLVNQLRRTEEAKAQAELESRHKSAFLAAMSHELRTPLNAVLGYAQMMQFEQFRADPERVREYSGHIETSGLLLRDLVDDLLDLSRIEAGRLDLHIEPIEIARCIADVVARLRPEAEARGIAIAVAIDPACNHWQGDARAIEQVVTNLLSNALRHTPDGGRIAIDVDPDGDDALRLRITDNGEGISPALLPDIFDPFTRGDPTVTEADAPDSLGLGLTICKRLVEAHRGRIGLENGEAGGTVATVILPRPDPPERNGKSHAA